MKNGYPGMDLKESKFLHFLSHPFFSLLQRTIKNEFLSVPSSVTSISEQTRKFKFGRLKGIQDKIKLVELGFINCVYLNN